MPRTRVLGFRWMPLALLLLAATAWYLSFFNAFAVPNTDFFAFRQNALDYLRLSPPESFKRLPVFPILIGILSLGIPGPHPVLLAAEMLNLLLAPVCLWLVYRIARRFLGTGSSFAVTALCAVNHTMVFSATQPLLEMVLLTTILLAVDLSLRGSRWAYAAAFLASMTRYEAAVLIPGLVLQDLWSGASRNKRTSILLGCAASIGIVAWIALSAMTHDAANPYVKEIFERESNYTVFLEGSLRVAADVLPRGLLGIKALRELFFLTALGLFATGLIVLIRRHRASSVTITGFLGAYVLIHVIFPGYQPRYVLPILWTLYLGMAKGLEALMATVEIKFHSVALTRWVRWGAIAGLGWVCAAVAVRMAAARLADLFVFALCCGAALWFWYQAGGVARGMRVSRWCVPALALCAALGFGLRASSREMQGDSVRNHKAQFRAVAEWYQGAAKPGDKLVVTMPWVVSYYSGLPDEYFVASGTFEASSFSEWLTEVKARHITYVVWDSDYGANSTSYHARRFKAELLGTLREQQPSEFEVVHEVRLGTKTAIIYRLNPEVGA